MKIYISEYLLISRSYYCIRDTVSAVERYHKRPRCHGFVLFSADFFSPLSFVALQQRLTLLFHQVFFTTGISISVSLPPFPPPSLFLPLVLSLRVLVLKFLSFPQSVRVFQLLATQRAYLHGLCPVGRNVFNMSLSVTGQAIPRACARPTTGSDFL